MNVLFTVVFAASAAALLFRDAAAFLPALLAGAGKAVALGLQLAAVWAVWLGFLRVAEDAGLLGAVSRGLRPLTRRLLHTENEAALSQAAVNLSANLLGMGGAATPAGAAAMRHLGGDGNARGRAMLFVIGCAGVQIFPSTVISLRAAAGAADPYDVYLPILLASLCALALGVGAVLLAYAIKRKKGRGA